MTMVPFEDAFWSSNPFSNFIVLILSTFIPLLSFAIYRIFFHPLANIPGPILAKVTSLWHIYQTFQGKDCSLVQELHRKYGKVVRIGPNIVDIADGAALGPIYVERGGFMKTSDYHNFHVDGFPTIFSTSDPAYRAPRAKAVAPLFSVGAIRRESHLISACVERFVKRLQQSRTDSKSRPVDLQEPARLLGFEVVNAYLFRHEYPDKVDGASGKSIIPWLNAFVDAGQVFYFSPWWFGFWLSKVERWRPQKDLEARSAESVHDMTMNLPVVLPDDSGKGDSYQGRLHQQGIPRDQIAAECKDVWFAGVHSFGALLAKTLWHLAKDTAIHDRLRTELLEHKHTDIDIQQLPYLSAVVKEGLRMAPVNARLPRVVPDSGWHFDGFSFPPGTVVGIATPQLFSNPNVFPDPTNFRPERWEDPSKEMQRDLVPFSVGIRQCIAKNLATAELFMAVKRVVESNVLSGAQPLEDKVETYEWFNMAVKGNRIDLVWPSA
ncbi:MAG: hypothetical protein LQ337_007094 [Flavoplaca oasis]|nr:MAG: hypothetical protein LQ337_007094 [Flavoplaca oasis]